MLLCTKCNTEKPTSDFYKSKAASAREGYTYWCKDCYADNYTNNRDRQVISNRRARVRRRYGMTLEEYERLKEAGCAVCGSYERLHMDHCHTTGQVRGVLCQDCNHAIGNAHDDPDRLRQLALYLEAGHNLAQGLVGPSY
jgi:hypothetical protein